MENYFWNTETTVEKKIYILVIYDIVSNKRRNAFAKKMNGYGFRVQKSAFEAMISEKLYHNLVAEVPRLIHEGEDSVRIYRITGYGEVTLFGVNEKIQNEEVIII
ncbi:CRISPR-associated endonuclease Cas2 [Brotaphodocola catenula]|uniref:CRISPR-associated endoribonuclease Cas2 n=1 Tax=Brotaphodocola catenula TaxID=2885361 RepID=A0AAE3AQ07_9FIRM|nr:CRISPR-associated endonuclease Cas2 [Brotaphodocola catenula]MCC2163580.1 CRISPR-associated endonuclease Cas2 [Brotaphodocola catenula]